MSKILNRALKLCGQEQKIGTPYVTILEFDTDGMVARAKGATVPTDGDAGYAVGCIFIDTDSGVSTTLYVNEGSTTNADFNVGTAGADGATSWDALYDLDKTLVIDEATGVTWTKSHASGNAFSLSGGAAATGVLLQFGHGASGTYDVRGTSNTWSIGKAGAAVLNASVTTPAIIGSANLTIDATSTGTITLGATSTGGITLTRAVTATHSLVVTGAGGSDKFTITEGDAKLSDGSLTLIDADNAATLDITNATVTTGNTVVITADAITDGSILYIDASGDTMDAGFYINCNDDTVSDFTVGKDGATKIITAVNSTKALEITGIQTSEDLVTLTSGGVTASGESIILINSSGASASGSNQIRIAPSGTPAAGSIGMEFVGAGKLMQAMYLDSDPTANSVVQINGGGALTNDLGVLVVSSDGALATGGNTLRVDVGGTPASGAIYTEFDFAGLTDTNENIGVKIDAGGKKVQALHVDADPVAGDVTYIHSDAVIASDKALVNINSAGAIASGGNALRVDVAGTPAAGAVYTEFDFAGLTDTNENVGVLIDAGGKKVQALKVDADPVAGDVAYFHSDAVIAADKGVVHVDSAGALANGASIVRVVMTGTPAATAYGLEIDMTGVTATNDPGAIFINGTGDDVRGINVDVDNTDVHGVSITGSGALAAGSALNVENDGTPAADTDAVARFAFTGTATNDPMVVHIDANTIGAAIAIDQDGNDESDPAVGIKIDTDNAGSGNQIALDIDQVDEAKSYFARFNATTEWSSAKDPETNAQDGWIKIMVGSTAYYIPYYAAS